MFTSHAIQGITGLINITGALASQYVTYSGTGYYSYFATQDSCAMSWKNPTLDVIDDLNEIMFKTALVASGISNYALMSLTNPALTSFYESYPVNISAGDTEIPQPQILEMKRRPALVFKSNYSYLAGALAAMMLGFSVVIPTLHGFWEMCCRVSLNPLEIAGAFNNDLLREQSSNIPAHHLTRGVRERRDMGRSLMIWEGMD